MRCTRCTKARTSARSSVKQRDIVLTRHLRARRRKRRRKTRRRPRTRRKPRKRLRRRSKSAEGGPKEGSDHLRRVREEAPVARSRGLGRVHEEAHTESVGPRVDQVVRKAQREGNGSG